MGETVCDGHVGFARGCGFIVDAFCAKPARATVFAAFRFRAHHHDNPCQIKHLRRKGPCHHKEQRAKPAKAKRDTHPDESDGEQTQPSDEGPKMQRLPPVSI